jgi:type IV secretory pathway TrbD component
MIAIFPNFVNVNVVVVGADRKMALIRGVLNNLAVAVGVF